MTDYAFFNAADDYAQFVTLIHDRREWIHRRVESLQFLADGSSRRHVSVDVTVPEAFAQAGYLPIALLEKRVLHAFDVSDGSGQALPVFSTWQNAGIGVAMLQSGLVHPADKTMMDCLFEVAYFPSLTEATDEADELNANEPLAKYAAGLTSDVADRYMELAYQLMAGFLLIVQLPKSTDAGSRIIVKFSYEAPVVPDGWLNPRPVRTSVALDWADSFHFEARAPEGVAVRSLEHVVRELDGSVSWGPAQGGDSGPLRVAHIAMRGGAGLGDLVEVDLVAERRGLPSLTAVAVLVTAGLVSIAPLVQASPWPWLLDGAAASSASTLLLLGPAIVMTFLVRGREHAISAQQLRSPRLAMALSAAVLFAAAANAGGIVGEPASPWVWLGLILASGALNLWFWLWWLRHSV